MILRRQTYATRNGKPSEWQFKPLNKPRSILQTIKAGTSSETKIRGYLFDFELSTPAELLNFAWNAKLGEKGSPGFGFIETRVDSEY